MPTQRRSRALLVGTAALLATALLGPALPAVADTHQPTASELRAAQRRVEAARRQVTTLQTRAELATEAYNGAVVHAHFMRQLSATATQAANQADIAYQGTLATATQAKAQAEIADAQAVVAHQAQLDAQATADKAQRQLDSIAIGAFQTDGQLGMVSQLFLAHDPLELANGRTLMNRVGIYQDEVIRTAIHDRAVAELATQEAGKAKERATAANDAAQQALTRAAAARSAAFASRHDAVTAANAATQAEHAAAAAKNHAMHLVALAEASLGRAVRTRAQLEAAAAAARRDAAGLDDGSAPSEAARTAIHWAFQEIGVPYSWGGGDENGPTEGFNQGAGTVGFDCSGLTLFVYGKAGIHLDHYTGSQWNEGMRINHRSDLLPGDLMFFAYDTSSEATIHHVAIYIGKGKMIEAPQTGDVVKVSSADRPDFIGGTRPWA